MQSSFSEAVGAASQGGSSRGTHRMAANHHQHPHDASTARRGIRHGNSLPFGGNNNNNGYDSDETEQPSQVAFMAAATARASMAASAAAMSSFPLAASRNQHFSSPSSTGAVHGMGSPPTMGFAAALQNSASTRRSLSSNILATSHRRDSDSAAPLRHPVASPATQALMQLSQGTRHLLRYNTGHNDDDMDKKPAAKKGSASQASKKKRPPKNTPKKKGSTPKTSAQQLSSSNRKIIPATAPTNNNTNVAYQVPANFADDWKIVSIRIPTTEMASMGIAVMRGTFPGLSPQPSNQHCTIRRILTQKATTSNSDSLDHGQTKNGNERLEQRYCGEKYGLLPRDWFLQPGYDYTFPQTTNHQKLPALPKLANFDAIAEWSKRKPYAPVCVLRHKETSTGSLPNQPEQATLTATTKVPSSASGTKKRKATTPIDNPPPKAAKHTTLATAPATSTQSVNAIDIVPFCKRCIAEKNNKKQMPRLHHSWCPKNRFFNNSGADDIMDRILEGRRL
ncbi:MAG: hypothetical protein SGARI_002532, partial [Bacillariaceae sp.]